MSRFSCPIAFMISITLAVSVTGCQGLAFIDVSDNDKNPRIEKQLAGKWIVTEWLCDTGSGPFNFRRNVGWEFTFEGSNLKVIQNNGDEVNFKLHIVPDSDPIQICLVSEKDFDEDGEVDLTIQRNCLFKLENGKLVMAYGSIRTNVELNTRKGESIANMPTKFVPDKDASLLTLERKVE